MAMTVRELINELSKIEDQNMLVALTESDDYWGTLHYTLGFVYVGRAQINGPKKEGEECVILQKY